MSEPIKIELKCVKMRKIHDLLSSDDDIAENLLTHECSFGIRLASRKIFEKGSSKEEVEQFQKDFLKEITRGEKIIKTLSLTSYGTTKIFPLVKERVWYSKRIARVKLIKHVNFTKKLGLAT